MSFRLVEFSIDVTNVARRDSRIQEHLDSLNCQDMFSPDPPHEKTDSTKIKTEVIMTETVEKRIRFCEPKPHICTSSNEASELCLQSIPSTQSNLLIQIKIAGPPSILMKNFAHTLLHIFN